MVENNNNEDQAKLEAERKRLFEEMMASAHRMNELSGPDGEWAKKVDEEVKRKISKGRETTPARLIGQLATFVFIIFSLVMVVKGLIIGGIICGFLAIVMAVFTLPSNDEDAARVFGLKNTAMICPYCNKTGKIRIKTVNNKKGISGGKATAALLTNGLSLFAIGLSRKEKATQAHCENCNNTWTFN